MVEQPSKPVMPLPGNESFSSDVSQFLPWLVEMGADEIILENPVNRMAVEPEKPPPPAQQLQKPTTKPPPPKKPVATLAATPVAAEAQSAAGLAAGATSLAELAAAFDRFTAHPLARTATRCCFLSGADQARVLLLCDKPRNDEDPTGDVLAGKNRVLGERMLQAIGLCGMDAVDGLEQVMLANFVPWRPPGNRGVTELEARDCVPFAQKLLQLVKPSLILCFGSLPGQYLAGGEAAIPKARGQWLSAHGIPMLTTFHPETLLKSPQSKRLAWHDLQAFRARLSELGSNS